MGKRELRVDFEHLPPEWELLLLCSRFEPAERERQKIRELLDNGPDWDALNRLIQRHRVWPLVCRSLKQAGCDGTNGALTAALEKQCRQNQIKSLQILAELQRLTKLFKERGIPSLSLKGLVLSHQLFGDISLRVSKDIDLLVHPDTLESAERILLQEGYRKADKPERLTGKQRALLLKLRHHFSYVSSASGICVELHWRVCTDAHGMAFDSLWAARAETVLNGKPYCTLSMDDNLLFLVMHGSKHAYFRLKWLCDVQEMIRSGRLRWERVFQMARELGVEHMLAQALLLSRQFFQTEIPSERISPRLVPYVSHLAKLAARQMFSDYEGAGAPCRSDYLLKKRYILALDKGMAGKLSFLRKHLYPGENDFEFIKLNDRFFALYFVLRPVAALGKFLLALGRRDART